MSAPATTKNDFTKGSLLRAIMSLAVPMTVAQLINILYNVIDRVYIGMMAQNSTDALTGIGLCLPIVSIVTAFANLFGAGGAPLCAMERGRGNTREAENIMGNAFVMLLGTGVVLTVAGLAVKRPLLMLFGASEQTIGYANAYGTIYLAGCTFVLLGLGMNNYITAQGFGRMGMLTVLIGAVVNILLDPLFIFVLHMGVAGAALATVLSQIVSTVWILHFLTGYNTILRLQKSSMKLQLARVGRIAALGFSNFVMSCTNAAVQVMYNTALQTLGGDLYVGIMTVINSVREVVQMPAQGVTSGAQPVVSYNYGANRADRVKKCIFITSTIAFAYTLVMWAVLNIFPAFFVRIFNRDAQLVVAAVPAMRLYFFGFYMQSLQFAGQSVFVALGKAKQAVFFSIFRKIILVIPLILLLPHLPLGAGGAPLGVDGVMLAEPVSNFVGGLACYVTMLLTVLPELNRKLADGPVQNKP